MVNAKLQNELKLFFGVAIILSGILAGGKFYWNSTGILGFGPEERIELVYAGEQDRTAEPTTAPVVEPEVGQATADATGTVTPSPTSTPTVTKAMAEKTTVGAGPVETIIHRVFGAEAELAIAVFKCESNLRPTALLSSKVEHSVGIAQINLAKNFGKGKHVHWKKAEGTTLEEKQKWLENPENNIRVAKQIRDGSGWRAWSCFTSKKYLKNL